MKLPRWKGWHLIGAYPDGGPDDVGSWVLHSKGRAMLLEVPEGLTVRYVKAALNHLNNPCLCYVTASHDHLDHLDPDAWGTLQDAFPEAEFLHPGSVGDDPVRLYLRKEPVWLIPAPKHSLSDVVTVFRGVAMTGDIELGMLASVNDEVLECTRRRSLKRLADFQRQTGYHIHTTVSAHLNRVRESVDWPSLFAR